MILTRSAMSLLIEPPCPRGMIVSSNTMDGEEVTYNPALLKSAITQSTVYREERRELAVGERIQLTAPDKKLSIRARDFATVEKIIDSNPLAVRLDSGKTLELESAKARHIEHGYAVDGTKAIAADRVLVCINNPHELTSENPIL